MPRIRITLLGTETLSCRGQDKVGLPGIFWTILGILFSASRYTIGRGRLANNIWPDSPRDAARRRLSTALWRIRKRLPPGARLISADDTQISLRLTQDVWIDSVAMEYRVQRALGDPDLLGCAAERARLGRALQLYKGDFLTQQDDDNIIIERERIRALYLDANYELAQAYARHDEWAATAETCRALCSIEPLREDAQRLLIEAHAANGNRALAIQQYRDFERLLDRDLSVPPMPQTQAIFQNILNSVIGTAGPSEHPRAISGSSMSKQEMHAMLSQMRGQLQSALNLIDNVLES